MIKNSIIFRGGYDKGYKIFIADENLFVCILIYFNKNIHFQWITKKYKNYKIKFSLKYKLFNLWIGNKYHPKNINDQNFAHFMIGYDKSFYDKKTIKEFYEILIKILFSFNNLNT